MSITGVEDHVQILAEHLLAARPDLKRFGDRLSVVVEGPSFCDGLFATARVGVAMGGRLALVPVYADRRDRRDAMLAQALEAVRYAAATIVPAPPAGKWRLFGRKR